jgi:hypothetical protein
VNLRRIEALVASAPSEIDERQRRRLEAYAALARRCEVRLHELRAQVEAALGSAATDPDAALDLACQMDDLEQVQPDAWLKAYVTALVDERTPESFFGEGPA